MIVIPMAGLSSRFYKAGYTKPKYMLQLDKKSLFNHSVESFKSYFETEKFIFIIRDIQDTKNFVTQKANQLGIKNFEIATLSEPTRGQAETVAIGLKNYEESGSKLTIFNIDTFRPNFTYPNLESIEDGYLEVFCGEGNNWSYVRPIKKGETRVELTAEKKVISNLCCTGLYHFSRAKDFFTSYKNYLSLPSEEWEKGELYIAPLYNHLIQKGRKIHFKLIDRDEVIFCGTPSEYEDLTIQFQN